MGRIRLPFSVGLALLAIAAAPADAVFADGRLTIPAAQLTVIEQVEVPAREAGVLEAVHVREGALVESGEELARIDDSLAELERSQAKLETDIAQARAANDVTVRLARKTKEVAEAELQRSVESVERFRRSVSQTELDRLRLAAERAGLEIEQAEHERQLDALTADLKANGLKIAELNVRRRQILAPIAGVVVQVNRRTGEWVEPGDAVLRILRIDRLRATGIVKVSELRSDLTGQRATFVVNLPGRPQAEFEGEIVFVSPEVNPVNGEVRIWAEIENKDRLLRPGLQGTLVIQTSEDRKTDPGVRGAE